MLRHEGGSTSTKETRHKPFYRSRLVVQEYKRQADWSFFTATPPLEALRSLLICATVDENSPMMLGQPVAWSEPVVFTADRCSLVHIFTALPGGKCL